MEKTKKTSAFYVLFAVQLLCTICCIVATLFQIVHRERSAITTPIVYLFACFFILLFMFWGRKRSILTLNIALTFLIASHIAQDILALNAGHVVVPLAIANGIAVVFALAFQNTLKENQKAAVILGGILVAVEIIKSALFFIVLLVPCFSDEMRSLQPLAMFFIATAIYAGYFSYCKFDKK